MFKQGVFVVLLLSAATPAIAQEEEAAEGTLGELVVTAQRRAENQPRDTCGRLSLVMAAGGEVLYPGGRARIGCITATRAECRDATAGWRNRQDC